jgi:2-amino-4-hydroxy-6-hydroxymethyldihydropteridine diphosphokinase
MRAYVGLGANLGDPQATLRQALAEIAALPDTRLVAASHWYRSAPVQAQGPDFVNAVVAIETALEPTTLLRALQRIEAGHGRERPYRNAPRTLDLDLLLYGDRVLDEPRLRVPHPRLHERAFVLVPLFELAPELEHPILGPLAPWRARVADQAIEVLPSVGAD